MIRKEGSPPESTAVQAKGVGAAMNNAKQTGSTDRGKKSGASGSDPVKAARRTKQARLYRGARHAKRARQLYRKGKAAQVSLS